MLRKSEDPPTGKLKTKNRNKNHHQYNNIALCRTLHQAVHWLIKTTKMVKNVFFEERRIMA